MAIADFHNHLVPGVDDGAQTVEEAHGGLAAMHESGVRTLVATPHVQASLTRQPAALEARLAEIDLGWATLESQVAPLFPDLEIHRGAEVMLDTPEPDFSDARLRLAGGPFVLVEFPYMTVPPRSERIIPTMKLAGWTPIIAHPERYGGVDPELGIIGEWRRLGAFLQVNVGSVLGRYGTDARRIALALLDRGWADYLCSDYHARGRVAVRECRRRIIEIGGEEQARLLTELNPARAIKGEVPMPVPPLRPHRGLWSRIRRAFR
ncbi:MAG TPA: CpsB/CapC family capsule biosynthesis tyrosine phosphatase [Longimicrobiales bacterium]